MTSDPPVWYCIPSARADGGTICLWKQRGYKVAVQRDLGALLLPLDVCDLVVEHEWDGYANAVNRLCCHICKQWPETLICVTGGDDIEPDSAHSPEEIQRQFIARFGGMHSYSDKGGPLYRSTSETYGVMQPTGDRWMVDESGRSASERVAYSPWLGRDWILRANGGLGPLHPDYWFFYVDEHLQEAATMQGVFWQRPDLSQYHHHWTRESNIRPEHMQKTDRREKWVASKALFERHKANGFKESLPCQNV